MALSDFSPEELAEIQFGSGWVDTGTVPVPDRAARSLQAADVAGTREDAAREARIASHEDMVLSRFLVRGEQPPTMTDVLARASRRMGPDPKPAPVAAVAEEQYGEEQYGEETSFAKLDVVAYMRDLKRRARMAAARRRDEAKQRREARYAENVAKAAAGKPSSPSQAWVWFQ